MNKMRKYLCLGLLAATALLISPPAARADVTFAGTGTGTTTLSYYIASAANYGTPRLNYVNATSDLSSSVLQFYTTATAVVVTNTSASGQAVIQAPGTGFSNGQIIVVRNFANDTYQRLVVSSANASTITATANLNFALASGDKVYLMTTAGTIPVGAATKEINAAGGGIYNGQEGKPFLLEVNGTSACKLNVASGVFQR